MSWSATFQKYSPLTFTIGFVEQPLGIVHDAFLDWQKGIYREVTSRPVDANTLHALRRLEPLTTPARRFVFLETKSTWTAYFDNNVRGADPFPRVSYLSQRLACRGLIAMNIPHTLDSQIGSEHGTYGAIQFQLFAPRQSPFLNYERVVYVSHEGRWKFGTHGTIQPFERVERYASQKIRDRFTPEMLEEYCMALASVFRTRHFTAPREC